MNYKNDDYQTNLYQNKYDFFQPDFFAEPVGKFDVIERDLTGEVKLYIKANYLKWDSDVFDFPCGRIEQVWLSKKAPLTLLQEGLKNVIKKMKNEGIILIDVRVDMDFLLLIQELEKIGFYMVDAMNIYVSNQFSGEEIGTFDYKIIENQFTRELGEEIIEFGMTSFTHSRMYQDPRVTKKQANDFYESLLRNFLSDQQSYCGVMIAPDSSPVGFFIGREDSKYLTELGYLWLIAVAPDYQGQGISKKLLSKFLRGMHERNSKVEIGTQINNLASNRLYKSFDLPVFANLISLHFWTL